MTGTESRLRMSRMFIGFRSPSPLPIGDASGITAAQPASSSFSAVTRSSFVYASTTNPARTRLRVAFRRPSTSGRSVSASPITSSLIHSFSPAARASSAVRIASSAV